MSEVSDGDFDVQLVKVWLQARAEERSTAWIGSQLGVTPRYARNRVKYLRAKGVAVPPLKRQSSLYPEKAEELKRLINGQL